MTNKTENEDKIDARIFLQTFVSFYGYKGNDKHFPVILQKLCFLMSNYNELICYIISKQITWPTHSESKGFLKPGYNKHANQYNSTWNWLQHVSRYYEIQGPKATLGY